MPPVLVLTQGDPAGIGPELLMALLAGPAPTVWHPLVVAERPAIEAILDSIPAAPRERLVYVDSPPPRRPPAAGEEILVFDPVAAPRTVSPGSSAAADAAGAIACLDAGLDLVRTGAGDALVTLPVSKASIAAHVDGSFRGHTDYLAAAGGLERYGEDYLMAFLAAELRVALLTVHVPLGAALESISAEGIVAACRCLHRHTGGTIAVPGINPHAGEGGLLGGEDELVVAPAVERASELGLPVVGPESPDSVFARARAGAFDWVLALYHDQGLIAVKTAAWGGATNWTLGLPVLRTSVDHGTAFDIAGQGAADVRPLQAVIETTLGLLGAGPSSSPGAVAKPYPRPESTRREARARKRPSR